LPKSKTAQRKAVAKPKTDFQVKESVIYEEKVPIGLSWLVVLLAAIGMLIWALVTGAMAPGPKNPFGIGLLTVIIVAFLAILWNFRQVTIRITNKEAVFKYGRLSTTVKIGRAHV
jgi:membrane protein YdbS with pleckstrin-like domain